LRLAQRTWNNLMAGDLRDEDLSVHAEHLEVAGGRDQRALQHLQQRREATTAEKDLNDVSACVQQRILAMCERGGDEKSVCVNWTIIHAPNTHRESRKATASEAYHRRGGVGHDALGELPGQSDCMSRMSTKEAAFKIIKS
jgi:hypothetical protein